jgi:hypothetical protein
MQNFLLPKVGYGSHAVPPEAITSWGTTNIVIMLRETRKSRNFGNKKLAVVIYQKHSGISRGETINNPTTKNNLHMY